MRIKRPLLALALPALFAIFFLAPLGAFAQHLLIPYGYSILVYDTNGTLLQTISDTNLDNGVWSIATDANGNIYVSTYWGSSNAIVKYGPGGTPIKSLVFLPSYAFQAELTVDPDGCLYVAYGDGQNVMKYGPNGNLLSYGYPAIFGSGGQFGFVYGTNGNIFAAGNFDSDEGGIFEYPPGSSRLFNPFIRSFGSVNDSAVAVDHAGYIYALNTANDYLNSGRPAVVEKYDEDGNLVSSFSVSTNSFGCLAVDNNGNVYVNEYGIGIYEYDAGGNFVRAFPAVRGFFPYFALEPVPQLSVATSGNQTIAFWSPPLTNYVLQTVTNPASTNWLTVTNGLPINGVTMANNSPVGFFRMPAADPEATNIYVSGLDPNDYYGCVFVDTTGGEIGGGDNPPGIAVDSSGNFYEADDAVGTVSKIFSVGGGSPFHITGLSSPGALAVDAGGNVCVSAGGYFSKFDSAGHGIITNFATASGPVACSPDGHVYTASNTVLAVYNYFGQLIFTNSAVTSPVGLAVDSGGNVYALDSSHNIYKYDSALNRITNYSVFDGNGAGPGGGLAVDSSDNLYVAQYDGGYDEYDAKGNFLGYTPGPDISYGSGQFIAVQFPIPQMKFAAGNQGFVYWTPRGLDYGVQSATSLKPSNWQKAAPGIGLVITNSPPGSVYQLVPAE